MTVQAPFSPPDPRDAGVPLRVTPLLALLGHVCVWLFVFSGFFVIREPSPYELLGVPVIGAAFLFGLTFPKPVIPVVALLSLYLISGFIGMTLASDPAAARFHVAVTAFLVGTSIFFACYCAREPIARIGAISTALQCGALLSALAGVAGYLNVAGTAETFTLFGRAKGTFQDPNVFGPFLVIAFVFAVYQVLSKPMRSWGFPMLVVGVCLAGILLSFSRASWGYLLLATALVAGLHYALTPHLAERIRILFLASLGMTGAVVGLLIALSVPDIRDQFLHRANLLNSYDAGELGRFGIQAIGFQMSLDHPFGLGTFRFRELLGLDPHNVYLNALMAHGWLGFFAYTTLILLTVQHLLKVILFHPPLRVVAVPVFSLFVGMAFMGLVIDTDRWRHFYLLLGLSWGMIAHSITRPYRDDRHANERQPTF
ncbi:MAG: O-antigen ligase family protein [Pseudomonadota bacterium]